MDAAPCRGRVSSTGPPVQDEKMELDRREDACGQLLLREARGCMDAAEDRRGYILPNGSISIADETDRCDSP
ncbi:hypothetical protein CBR_g36487 [Chara braunii]|uniref:Uncharacterized protein n=1 Tax=Chara braunii TaxID=69332 RepID=A0A388LL37_CHABU|nr:hypothetical protein CBR_g36487 [Chara braunii]|eukprot:GBG82961.1 hypothetical protein CBR_g36487 [Chara braunii]